MYDHTLHQGKKHFCRYWLQALSTEETLKRHIKDFFKTNDKQRLIIPKKGKYLKFINDERKIKSPFMIHAGFESILVPAKSRRILYEQISRTYCLQLWR